MREDIPTDVLILILQSLPNLDTLSSVIRVSRRLHAVFAAHPQLIYDAVARAETGRAFAYAAQLTILQREDADSAVEWDLLRNPPLVTIRIPMDIEADFMKWDSTRMRMFSENARTVGALQALYSRWYADPSSPSSVLERAESFRFNRAMYRFMVFWTVYMPAWTETERIRQRIYSGYNPGGLEWFPLYTRLWNTQMGYLVATMRTKQERLEFAAIGRFLQRAACWAKHKFGLRSQPVHSSELWHGIAKVVALRQRNDYMHHYKYDHGFIQDVMLSPWPLLTINDIPMHRLVYHNDILSNPRPRRACAVCFCQHPDGISQETVYNPSNWDMLDWDTFTVEQLFGRLSKVAYLRRTAGVPELLQAVVECAHRRGHIPLPEAWLCRSCLALIVGKYRKAALWKLTSLGFTTVVLRQRD